jgi:hypothetical protein
MTVALLCRQAAARRHLEIAADMSQADSQLPSEPRDGCVYRKLDSAVTVMKAAEDPL